MGKWRKLDMVRTWDHPQTDQLVALRMTPTKGNATFYRSERYDAGCFKPDSRSGRKLWWHGTHGCEDPTRMKQHYEIWWCPVPEYDGY